MPSDPTHFRWTRSPTSTPTPTPSTRSRSRARSEPVRASGQVLVLLREGDQVGGRSRSGSVGRVVQMIKSVGCRDMGARVRKGHAGRSAVLVLE
jgi:hypothetical protein